MPLRRDGVGFSGENGKVFAGADVDLFSVDLEGAAAADHEVDFGHVFMSVRRGRLTRLKGREGELGDTGDFAMAEDDLLLDGGIVGDAFGGEFGFEWAVDHEVDG